MSIVRFLAIVLLATFMSAPAMAQRINFGSGIGYYVFYDGSAKFLYFTTEISEKFDDKRVMRIPKYAEFYTYGIDFSHAFGVAGGLGGMQIIPLPPHLAGIGMMHLTKEGKLEGRYIVHFTPVPGYQEKVYRISIPYLFFLSQEKASYDYFALSVFPDGRHGQGYLFRFSEDEPRFKLMVDALGSTLTAGASLEGELYLEAFRYSGRAAAGDHEGRSQD